jgi:hypothetical protein
MGIVTSAIIILPSNDLGEAEVNVSLDPIDVYGNDTMFVNVTVPSSFGIQSAMVDMNGFVSLVLSLVDNSSGIDLWQVVWVVPVLVVGDYVAAVTLIDVNNISFFAGASWSFLSDNVDGNYSENRLIRLIMILLFLQMKPQMNQIIKQLMMRIMQRFRQTKPANPRLMKLI